ncbi:hypothetical protein XH84_09830 [Bradyrhizobium nanningense]|nr:hypothetical protein [Bradyrhizobium sp. CCBAU 45389]RXH33566.1 hypothetical protein XH84_09830 [Bradyrhizobium nanningense]
MSVSAKTLPQLSILPSASPLSIDRFTRSLAIPPSFRTATAAATPRCSSLRQLRPRSEDVLKALACHVSARKSVEQSTSARHCRQSTNRVRIDPTDNVGADVDGNIPFAEKVPGSAFDETQSLLQLRI